MELALSLRLVQSYLVVRVSVFAVAALVRRRESVIFFRSLSGHSRRGHGQTKNYLCYGDFLLLRHWYISLSLTATERWWPVCLDICESLYLKSDK